jgi:predicted Fe-S protein YdhL (DUF1289 family)
MSVVTPCTRVCVIDTETGLCEGCGRTLAEIAGWASMDDEARRRVMAALAGRLQRNRQAALELATP